jgi:hypothetical protein
VKTDRPGDWLWEQWDGEGYESEADPNKTALYVTFDEVDVQSDLVKRALASCIQRDGVSDSLGDGFKMVDKARIVQGYVGYVEGEKFPFVTDEFGETLDGDVTDYIFQATWVEISM